MRGSLRYFLAADIHHRRLIFFIDVRQHEQNLRITK